MKMNTKQFIFSPVWSHTSGSSKGRLLGKESGSQESQEGGQGQAQSDKGTVPQHLNTKAEQDRDSNQGQLTCQWLPDEAVIARQIWRHARKLSQQGRAWSDEGNHSTYTKLSFSPGSEIPLRAAFCTLAPAMILHFKSAFYWTLPCLIIPFLMVFLQSPEEPMPNLLRNVANRTEITVTTNISCFTDITVFGITRITSVYLFGQLPFAPSAS